MIEKNKTKIISTIIIIISMLIVLFSVLLVDGPQAIYRTVKGANFKFLLIAFSLISGFWIFGAMSLNSLLKLLGFKIGAFKVFKVTMTGAFFNAITPSSTGGQPVQIIQLSKYKIPAGVSGSVVILLLIINNIVTLLLGFISAAYSYYMLGGNAWFKGAIMMVGILLSTLVTLLISLVIIFPRQSKALISKLIHYLAAKNLIKNSENKIVKIDNEIDAFYDSFHVFKRKGLDKLIPCFIFVALQNICLWSIPHIVFLSIGAKTSAVLLSVAAACMVAMISAYVPLPGASLGAEGAFVTVFGSMYSNVKSMGIVVILWRVFTFYLPIILGSLFVLDFNKEKRSKEDE